MTGCLHKFFGIVSNADSASISVSKLNPFKVYGKVYPRLKLNAYSFDAREVNNFIQYWIFLIYTVNPLCLFRMKEGNQTQAG